MIRSIGVLTAGFVFTAIGCGGSTPSGGTTTAGSTSTTGTAGTSATGVSGTTTGRTIATTSAGATSAGTTGAETTGVSATTGATTSATNASATTGGATGDTIGTSGATTTGGTTATTATTTGGTIGTTGATTSGAVGTTGTTGGTTAAVGATTGATTSGAVGSTTGATTSGGTTTGATTGSTTGGTTGGTCPADGTVANSGCPTASDSSCDTSTGNVLTCSTVVAGGLTCQEWVLTTNCEAAGLSCQSVNSTIACYCPPNAGNTLYADAYLGSDSSALVPSGIETPAQCRFATLTHALSVAAATSGVTSVLATGFDGGTPEVFSKETFPLVVPASLTLGTTTAPSVADYVIPVSGLTDAGILLNAGTTLSGFTIVDDGGVAGSSAVLIASTGVTASNVTVAGGSPLPPAVGLQVIGAGSTAALNTVTVQDFGSEGLLVGPGATATIDTVTATGNQVGVQAEGTLTGSTLTIQSSVQYGAVFGDAGTATLTGLTATGNGSVAAVFDAGYAGVLVLGGTTTLSGSSVTHSGGSGLQVNGGSVYLGTDTFGQNCASDVLAYGVIVLGGSVDGGDVTVSSNTCSGVGVEKANAYFNGLTSQGNSGDGVVLDDTNAVATIVNAALNQNGNRGLYVIDGTATVSGAGSIDGNGTATTVAGVRADKGSLTLTGSASSVAGLQISNNGLYGVHLLGATSDISNVTISGNGSNGVDLTSNASGATPTTTLTTCTIESNRGDGVAVHASPNPNNGADTFSATGNTITENTGIGIALLGDAGSIGANLATNTISLNSGEGISISQSIGNTTDETVQGNKVFQNGATAGAAAAAGIDFVTASTLNSFNSNAVYANGGDQVLFQAGSNAFGEAWTITGGSATSCADANQFYCYSTGSFGVANTAGGIVNVTANYDSWQNGTPSSGVDYSTGVTVNKNDVCAFTPPTTCP